MFWRKNLFTSNGGKLKNLEKIIIEQIALELPNELGNKVRFQVSHLKQICRYKVNRTNTTEFYPEKFKHMPDDILFRRNQEFRLAHLKFRIGEIIYSSSVRTYNGRLFSLTITPPPPSKIKGEVCFLKVDVEQELENDI